MKNHPHSPEHNTLVKKHELETNEVLEVLGFMKRYGKMIGAGLIAAAIMAILSSGYSHYKAKQQTKAGKLFTEAKSAQQLEEIVTKYGATPSAPVALLKLAKDHFNDGEVAQAREQYNRFLKKYSQSELRPIAEMGLAYCQEADGDFNGAAEQFSALNAKYKTSYLHPQLVLNIARCKKLAGSVDDARVMLEDFLISAKGTRWTESAETALQELTLQ